jgi:purine-binding chemotaxis protein CheW
MEGCGMKVVQQAIEMEEEQSRSLCSMSAGDENFGINTEKIREVLGEKEVERIPMAPTIVAGVVPYRGDILTTVSFRALLGLPENAGAGCVLVMEEETGHDRFGLVVDRVGGVIAVDPRTLEPNPSTLEPKYKWLFEGVYKTAFGVLIQLDPQKLRPSRIIESGMFRHVTTGEA